MSDIKCEKGSECSDVHPAENLKGIENHKLQFDTFTTQKHFWMSVHNMSAFLFTVFVMLHIKYNWRSLFGYTKKIKELKISKEAVLAIVLVVFIVGLISSHAFLVRRILKEQRAFDNDFYDYYDLI